MRHQGRITHQKNDKGFVSSPRMRVAKNLRPHQVLLEPACKISRQRARDLRTETRTQGRSQAHRVAFVGERTGTSTPTHRANILLPFALLFLVFVATMVFTGRLPHAVLWLYLGASMIAFVAYALDKSATIHDRWRTPESTLHLFGLIGGWPGALAAQQLLRHKSSKASFQGVFWVTVAVNCCGLGWLLTTAGRDTLRPFIGGT
jgi:uncharacterized membrane protein YsdA (DUF1294 family)